MGLGRVRLSPCCQSAHGWLPINSSDVALPLPLWEVPHLIRTLVHLGKAAFGLTGCSVVERKRQKLLFVSVTTWWQKS